MIPEVSGRPLSPSMVAPTERLAARWLLPLMILSLVFVQQADPILVGIGAVVSILTTVAAISLLLSKMGRSAGALAFVTGTLALRVARLASDAPALVLVYTIFAGALFCFVGAVMALRNPRRVYRQLVFLWLVCVPVMLLQLLGVGEWTQALRTDSSAGDYSQHATLFVRSGEAVISALQARPAGLLPSNNLMSMLLVFTIGLHYARANRSRLSWRDWLLSCAAVLSMSKFVFLVFAVMALWVFVVGDRARRVRVVKVMVLLAVLTAVYAWLFPGVFAFTTSWETARQNFLIRLNDLLIASGSPYLQQFVDLTAAPRIAESIAQGRQSGYATIAKYLPYVFGVALLAAPWFFRGLKAMRRRAPEWLFPTTLCLINVAGIPLISSFLASVIYWYMAGFAVLPVLLLLERRFQPLFVTSRPDLERQPWRERNRST